MAGLSGTSAGVPVASWSEKGGVVRGRMGWRKRGANASSETLLLKPHVLITSLLVMLMLDVGHLSQTGDT